MSIASSATYLEDTVKELKRQWPDNRTVNIVCHGHSVPAGYFATPVVDSLNAYPHLLYVELKHRFPCAVVNVIVTAAGGEDSESGCARFESDVMCHRPDIVTIDYGLNDRRIGLARAGAAWESMISMALSSGSRVILLTPTADVSKMPSAGHEHQAALGRHAEQIIRLAEKHEIGLADSFSAFQKYAESAPLTDLLSWPNHPNRAGHELVTQELLRWFPFESSAGL